ncbi:hypothetical protein AHAS_Ahas12G0015600 [Arachis hypogaea]
MIGDHVTNIQVNIFDCGGIAIGFCISHKIIDGDSLDTFLKVWTEKAGCNYNSELLTKPNFATNSLFPTSTLHFRDLSRKTWGSIFRKEKWITRRFLFKNSAIATLKTQIVAKSSSNPLKNSPNTPSRVQIISALFWKYFMAASKDQFGTQRPSILLNTMNLRRRMAESLHPKNSIEHKSEHELNLNELVSKVKKSIEEIDMDFVARLQSEEERRSIIENFLRKMSLSNNKGVEALEGLLTYATLDPSPLAMSNSRL